MTVVRFAEESELEEINEIRKAVNDLHAKGNPTVFRPFFSEALRSLIYDIYSSSDKRSLLQ
ncbi:MAG: hypothetical protein ACI4S4_06420 [Candidatus Ornithospirochaeta sp.]